MTHQDYMKYAIAQANIASSHDDIPIGAIVVYNNKIISISENRREVDNDPTAHAEILAIKGAGKLLGNWNLSNCSLYVTLEPCAMCSGAIINSHISNIYFGAYDSLAGCCGSVYNLMQDKRFNFNANVYGGILKDECSLLIREFFSNIRNNDKNNDNLIY